MNDKLNLKLYDCNGIEIELNEKIFSNEFITTVCSIIKKHSREKFVNNICTYIYFDDNDFDFYRIDTAMIYNDNTIHRYVCGFSSGGYFFECFECERELIYKLIENIR